MLMETALYGNSSWMHRPWALLVRNYATISVAGFIITFIVKCRKITTQPGLALDTQLGVF